MGSEDEGYLELGKTDAESNSRGGSLGGTQNAVMLLDGACFLHDKLVKQVNTFGEWKKWEEGRKKIQMVRKDVQGIEKGTKTVE
jgi:hypothetical protein